METVKAKIKVSLKYSEEQQCNWWYFGKERILPFVPFIGMEYQVLSDYYVFGYVTDVRLDLDDSILVDVEVIDSCCVTDEKELKDEYNNEFTKEGWVDGDAI